MLMILLDMYQECWEHSCIVPDFSCSICLSPCFNTNAKNSLIYCEFQLWWCSLSYPSVHGSLVMALGSCSADNFYHFKAEHLFTSHKIRKSWCKRMNNTFLQKTLEQEIKFLKTEVFIAGKVLAELSFNLCKQSGYFCCFEWRVGKLSFTYPFFFFCFALLYILHWDKGLRPDWSVAEQLLILSFCGLTPCIAL